MFRGGSYADLGSTACSRKLRSSTIIRDCRGEMGERRSPTSVFVFRFLYTHLSFPSLYTVRNSDSLVIFFFSCSPKPIRYTNTTLPIMEVPLLGRDVNQELTEFWSPTRRPPRAPPSSPKLTAYDLDHAHQKRSIAELRTLAYLDQQLGITLPCADTHRSRASDSEKPSRRFSFQTQWSSDEENSATNGIHQPTQRYDDDGITLVDVSSPPRSSVSEVNTLSGEDMADAGCDSLEPWIECASRYKPTFSKPWTPAVSTERSFAKGIGIHPRPDALPKEVQDHRASCPSAFTHRTSSPLTRCVSTEQSMAIPLMDNDERSQVSMPNCSSRTYWRLIHIILYPLIPSP